MRKIALLALVLLTALMGVMPLRAADQITYISQPDEVYIFLNNIAFARDTITLPSGVSANVTLPASIIDNTLILREDNTRVKQYRLQRGDSGLSLSWETGSGEGAKAITLEYLLGGLSWTPRYDMWLGETTTETVDLSFFAEIQNTAFDLEAVTTHLIAGRVDTSQQVDSISQVTMNQMIVGYDEPSESAGEVGAATIQYIYDIGAVTADTGETVYLSQFEGPLPARRTLIWNAEIDQQVSVIYKVRNDSEVPLPEGIVRSYQNDYFIGSDFVEVTPVGSEGSITVGQLQDVRVKRTQSQTAITGVFFSTQYNVELSLTNFGADPVTVEVVDRQNTYAEELVFSSEPTRETGNLLRWVATIEPGETVTYTYEYKTR
ncbi:MAG: DUF4139 domain-containing protein [Chloroflexi bacterium]|nr:DUF4139 domain-containing protein [Chloroflexota bacterium]MCC6896713.1 DUF4139 domain-containing protein [Anaerolineae bacterium]